MIALAFATSCLIRLRCRWSFIERKQPNDGLQLRRAINIQAEGERLLEKTRYRAVSCKALFGASVEGTTLTSACVPFPYHRNDSSSRFVPDRWFASENRPHNHR